MGFTFRKFYMKICKKGESFSIWNCLLNKNLQHKFFAALTKFCLENRSINNINKTFIQLLLLVWN